MSTTDLFVELIVVGIGAMAWLALFALAVFGTGWADADWLFSLPALVPLLALTYVVGIVVDRVTDVAFDRLWGRALYRRHYPGHESRAAYYDDRRLIYMRAERLADLLEYGRSRLRISRGWAFNAAMLAVATNVFVWTRLEDAAVRAPISAFATVFWVALAVGAWYSWRRLDGNDYRRCREQAAFLRAESSG